MNNYLEMYFKQQKEIDKTKIDMSRNEMYDPKFEAYIEGLVKSTPTRALMKYPDEMKLYEAYCEYYGMAPQNIAIGHGSDELIGRIFQLHKDKVFYIGPHEYYMAQYWADIHNIKLAPTPNDAEVIYMGNPNSNNGVDNTQRIKFFLSLGKILIVDEVYNHFNGGGKKSFIYESRENENLWVINSMSKELGLCGFRAGVAFGTQSNMESLHAIRQAITCNSLTCEVISRLLKQKEFIQIHYERMLEGKLYLESKIPSEQAFAPYSLLLTEEIPESFKKKVYFLEGERISRVACTTKEIWKKLGV